MTESKCTDFHDLQFCMKCNNKAQKLYSLNVTFTILIVGNTNVLLDKSTMFMMKNGI